MLKQIFAMLLVALTAPALLAQEMSLPESFEQYQWKNRLLLVFASDSSDALYKRQLRAWNGYGEGFEERDLLALHVFASGKAAMKNQKTAEAETLVDGLYQRYGLRKGDFGIILIGKDGTVKLRLSTVLEASKLFSVIDAMPMRKREMREGG